MFLPFHLKSFAPPLYRMRSVNSYMYTTRAPDTSSSTQRSHTLLARVDTLQLLYSAQVSALSHSSTLPMNAYSKRGAYARARAADAPPRLCNITPHTVLMLRCARARPSPLALSLIHI